MDNSTFGVTNTAMNISIEPGGFRVFGNKLAILGNNEIESTKTITLSPNPTSIYFTLSTNTTKVAIYSITGQLVKSYKNNFNSESQFEIGELNNGIYLVKVTDTNDREVILKLVKQ